MKILKNCHVQIEADFLKVVYRDNTNWILWNENRTSTEANSFPSKFLEKSWELEIEN